jgi:hypothetical protein
MRIKTACWFAKIPNDHIRIGISRGTPRGIPAGYRQYRALCPRPWFKSVEPAEYLRLYGEILDKLDPEATLADITGLANGRTPVLCCFESAPKIHQGEQWCHRHLVAQWLEQSLQIDVQELDHPELDRFAKLKSLGIDLPNYKIRKIDRRRAAALAILGGDLIDLATMVAHRQKGISSTWPENVDKLRPRIVSLMLTATNHGYWTPDSRIYNQVEGADFLERYLRSVGTLLRDGHFSEAKQTANVFMKIFDDESRAN